MILAITIRLSSLYKCANCQAYHTHPSDCSPSPINQNTLLCFFSRYFKEYASPVAAQIPTPNEPVATSTNCNLAVGCPYKAHPKLLVL